MEIMQYIYNALVDKNTVYAIGNNNDKVIIFY